jgi:hypothetical protein
MYRILSANPTLQQHIAQINLDPLAYLPDACPHCGLGGLWQHGFYERKADRSDSAWETSLNPVFICRFFCSGCRRTCSRLPLCIAPLRWYDWELQQNVLEWLLAEISLRQASIRASLDRRTVRRWWAWLNARTDQFAFHLRSRFPELGRASGDFKSFWKACLKQLPLSDLMAWLDKELAVP